MLIMRCAAGESTEEKVFTRLKQSERPTVEERVALFLI